MEAWKLGGSDMLILESSWILLGLAKSLIGFVRICYDFVRISLLGS